ncbi:hypothetical protein BJF78_25870 [Pseudonocardia sp. CNS-139]|nr:hypothetical protein BJF78_25870 [Pseudonocardia sp. CNS-139]
MRRPGPLRWWWYAMGGALPPRFREWVLHDLTVRTWRVPAVVRSLVQMAPRGAGGAVPAVRGPGCGSWAGAGRDGTVGMIYAVAFAEAAAEHRVRKAGYPSGTAQAVRDELGAGAREAAAARYAARWRAGPPSDRSTPRSSG